MSVSSVVSSLVRAESCMRINRENALRLWDETFGNVRFAEDFHGNLMCRDAYSDPDFSVPWRFGGLVRPDDRVYCGWNIHHVLPLAAGGTSAKSNLLCTNIATNDAAEDKITFWIDDCLYQVKRVPGEARHEIVRLEGPAQGGQERYNADTGVRVQCV